MQIRGEPAGDEVMATEGLPEHATATAAFPLFSFSFSFSFSFLFLVDVEGDRWTHGPLHHVDLNNPVEVPAIVLEEEGDGMRIGEAHHRKGRRRRRAPSREAAVVLGSDAPELVGSHGETAPPSSSALVVVVVLDVGLDPWFDGEISRDLAACGDLVYADERDEAGAGDGDAASWVGVVLVVVDAAAAIHGLLRQRDVAELLQVIGVDEQYAVVEVDAAEVVAVQGEDEVVHPFGELVVVANLGYTLDPPLLRRLLRRRRRQGGMVVEDAELEGITVVVSDVRHRELAGDVAGEEADVLAQHDPLPLDSVRLVVLVLGRVGEAADEARWQPRARRRRGGAAAAGGVDEVVDGEVPRRDEARGGEGDAGAEEDGAIVGGEDLGVVQVVGVRPRPVEAVEVEAGDGGRVGDAEGGADAAAAAGVGDLRRRHVVDVGADDVAVAAVGAPVENYPAVDRVRRSPRPGSRSPRRRRTHRRD